MLYSDIEFSIKHSFPEDLPYFCGHFEGNPILPGIVQIKTVSDIIYSKFANFKLIEVSKVKFLMPIGANQEIEINIKLNFPDESNIKCDAVVETGGNIAASMTLYYKVL